MKFLQQKLLYKCTYKANHERQHSKFDSTLRMKLNSTNPSKSKAITFSTIKEKNYFRTL